MKVKSKVTEVVELSDTCLSRVCGTSEEDGSEVKDSYKSKGDKVDSMAWVERVPVSEGAPEAKDASPK